MHSLSWEGWGSNDDIQSKSKVSLLSPSLGFLGLWSQKPCLSFCFGEVWFQLAVSRPCLHKLSSPCSEFEAAHHHRRLPTFRILINPESLVSSFLLLDVINITSPVITIVAAKLQHMVGSLDRLDTSLLPNDRSARRHLMSRADARWPSL